MRQLGCDVTSIACQENSRIYGYVSRTAKRKSVGRRFEPCPATSTRSFAEKRARPPSSSSNSITGGGDHVGTTRHARRRTTCASAHISHGQSAALYPPFPAETRYRYLLGVRRFELQITRNRQVREHDPFATAQAPQHGAGVRCVFVANGPAIRRRTARPPTKQPSTVAPRLGASAIETVPSSGTQSRLATDGAVSGRCPSRDSRTTPSVRSIRSCWRGESTWPHGDQATGEPLQVSRPPKADESPAAPSYLEGQSPPQPCVW
jgi:hypothetical protein